MTIVLKNRSIWLNLNKFVVPDNSAGIYLFRDHNKNSRTRYEICSKLTIKTLEFVNDVVLQSLLLTLNKFYSLF